MEVMYGSPYRYFYLKCLSAVNILKETVIHESSESFTFLLSAQQNIIISPIIVPFLRMRRINTPHKITIVYFGVNDSHIYNISTNGDYFIYTHKLPRVRVF